MKMKGRPEDVSRAWSGVEKCQSKVKAEKEARKGKEAIPPLESLSSLSRSSKALLAHLALKAFPIACCLKPPKLVGICYRNKRKLVQPARLSIASNLSPFYA